MEELYAIHCERGNITARTFKDWIFLNGSYGWIDAEISFTKTDASIVDIIYSILFIRNTSYIDRLIFAQSLGYYMRIVYSSDQLIYFTSQKKPEYAKHAYLIMTPQEDNIPERSIIWNEMADSVVSKRFQQIVSHQKLSSAVEKLAGTVVYFLSSHLIQIPKGIQILRRVKTWIRSFDWKSVSSEYKTEFKLFENKQNDYVWILLNYRNSEGSSWGCFGRRSWNELDIMVHTGTAQSRNHTASNGWFRNFRCT